MDAPDLARTISRLRGVESLEVNGDTFFSVGDQPEDQRMPFATLVHSDAHDLASNLARPGVYRLNLGLSCESYAQRFGPPPSCPLTAEPVDTGHDYTTLEVLMPHPIYASLAWVCVLSPSTATFESLEPLIEEAHRFAADRRARRESRT